MNAVGRTPRILLTLGAALIVLLMLNVGAARAATFTVTNTNDSGPGSLRQAVLDANATPGPDTITFAVTGTITLTSGQLTVTDHLAIDGPGAASLTVSGNNASRVLEVGGGVTLDLEGITVANGSQGCCTPAAGGILNNGTATVTNTTFSGNSAFNAGGILNHGTLDVTNSTFSGNSGGSAGAIWNRGGLLTVTNSTFSGNSAFVAGGIRNNGTATVTNSTFSGNSGNGIFPDSGALTLRNSIMANSPCAVALFGVIIDGGGNLSWPDTTCPGINQDPLLGPLQNNGGPTETHALLPGSPAIDAALACPPPFTDQRGVARPQGAACDIGAYEFEVAGCPPNGDEDNDGLTDANENRLRTLLGNADSDGDGISDGNDDANGNDEDDEDEDDDENDGCPDEDSDGDGEDDEDEDDDEDDD